MDCYLSQEKFDRVKRILKAMIDDDWRIDKMVACIYDLYQEYIISEEQEAELYSIADPFEDYNNCSEYWRDMDYKNPLLDYLK